MEHSIAIDIVFLFPKELENEATRINRILTGQQNNSKIDFTNSQALPHISLAMGGVLPNNLDHLKNLLNKFSTGKKPIEIIIDSLVTKEGESEKITSFQLKENSHFNSFHAELINLVNPIMKEKVDNNSFLTNEISTDSINWVNEYFESHSFVNFWPHITLGIGKYTESFPNYSFLANKLAICKLDDYCTCEKIIWETTLR
ncbi:MAG: hypothetical protein KTR26_06575 [Flammeovirgaceae bacterium]|nr:hypothetical protein [Flammeovirgaceae bacterium]